MCTQWTVHNTIYPVDSTQSTVYYSSSSVHSAQCTTVAPPMWGCAQCTTVAPPMWGLRAHIDIMPKAKGANP
eukprot:1039319-Pyramimonas_sp.AAC.1